MNISKILGLAILVATFSTQPLWALGLPESVTGTMMQFASGGGGAMALSHTMHIEALNAIADQTEEEMDAATLRGTTWFLSSAAVAQALAFANGLAIAVSNRYARLGHENARNIGVYLRSLSFLLPAVASVSSNLASISFYRLSDDVKHSPRVVSLDAKIRQSGAMDTLTFCLATLAHLARF